MSKSLGNTISPSHFIDGLPPSSPAYGADVLRLMLVSSDYTSDVLVSDQLALSTSNNLKKIRNTLRFLLGNLYDFDPSLHSTPYPLLEQLDQYILHTLSLFVQRSLAHYEQLCFFSVVKDALHFVNSDLSSFYLHSIKSRLYTTHPNSPLRRSAQTTLSYLLEALTKVLAPIACHTAEDDRLSVLAQNLATGAISGVIGATLTYPLDVIKTRLQNFPKSTHSGICQVIKNIAHGGPLKFYKGLPAVLVGIIPEKAIKLSVNDFAIDAFKTHLRTESLPIPYLVLSGAIAGTAQVIATNPMEVVKIRMQVQQTSHNPGYIRTIRQLGLLGLYRGVGATLLRDVPFSMLYFSIYGYMRQALVNSSGDLPLHKAFFAGLSAGVIASGIVTPADVVKTRLQAPPPKGIEPYVDIIPTFHRIIREEGYRTLYRGVIPRMIVISPLFAISLAAYEVQKTWLK
ncbi:mitochondrial substrate carrier family protein X-like [Schistocerca gregaria]|uniref:mitochondrial substrate carrier family protein X-like n=1 Tax=Schistocerca gregaria TaxID=7010 RepID=UPI00211F391F|nr:mitochondrial substrate carrier family protein X-like [Schistocerca gregaria]